MVWRNKNGRSLDCQVKAQSVNDKYHAIINSSVQRSQLKGTVAEATYCLSNYAYSPAEQRKIKYKGVR